MMITADEAKMMAIRAVEQLEAEASTIIPHYLTFQTLTSALAKAGIEFPIVGIDPITMSLTREISRIFPELSGADVSRVRIAIAFYLKDNDYADRFFERQDIWTS